MNSILCDCERSFWFSHQITHEKQADPTKKEVSRRMRTYESKEALIEAIQIASQKYLAEFAEIPETLKDHQVKQ